MPSEPETLVVTGALGGAGRWVVDRLAEESYDIVAVDRELPVGTPPEGVDFRAVDLVDAGETTDLVLSVDPDAVVHLAAVHGIGLRFADSLDANFRGTMNVLDAVRSERIERLVYASSHHVHGLHPRDGFAGDDAPLAPDAVYGLGKAYGEVAATTYARRYDVRTLIVRIGNADPTVTDDRTLRMWTSARDLAQLVSIGLDAPDVRCDVVYGVSACPRPLYRNLRATLLGYRPVDRAEDNLDPAFLAYDAMPPELGRDWVGGAYAVSDLPAPEEDA